MDLTLCLQFADYYSEHRIAYILSIISREASRILRILQIRIYEDYLLEFPVLILLRCFYFTNIQGVVAQLTEMDTADQYNACLSVKTL